MRSSADQGAIPSQTLWLGTIEKIEKIVQYFACQAGNLLSLMSRSSLEPKPSPRSIKVSAEIPAKSIHQSPTSDDLGTDKHRIFFQYNWHNFNLCGRSALFFTSADHIWSPSRSSSAVSCGGRVPKKIAAI